MSLPEEYNKALRKTGGFYAAWFPITTPFRIGDFGLVHDGVFQKIGHLDDLRDDGFNVPLRTAPGQPAPLDLVTEGVKTIRTLAGVAAPIPNFPAGEMSATITYEFQKQNSFVVKAAELTVEQMENVQQMAEELARLRREEKWSHQYRVVSSTYTAKDCLVLLAQKTNTSISFEGAASALQLLDSGKVEVKPTISSSSDTVLKVVGKTGAMGIKLFKLKMISVFGSNVKLLKEQPLQPDEKAIEADWGEDLPSDL
jgi:hypothetical protein